MQCLLKEVTLLSPGISSKQLVSILGVLILGVFSLGRLVSPHISGMIGHIAASSLSLSSIPRSDRPSVVKVIFPVTDICFPNQIYAQLLFPCLSVLMPNYSVISLKTFKMAVRLRVSSVDNTHDSAKRG